MRTSQEKAARSQRQTSSLAIFLVLLGLVVALDVLFTSGTEIILSVVNFVESYPTRFLAFYEPKVTRLVALVNDAVERMEISEQVSDAWDFTVALVTLVCVHQVIEATRTSVVSRLRSSTDSSTEESAMGTKQK